MSQHIHRTLTLIFTERWTITWLSDDQMTAAHADSIFDSDEAPIIVQYSQTMVCEVEEEIQTVMNGIVHVPAVSGSFPGNKFATPHDSGTKGVIDST